MHLVTSTYITNAVTFKMFTVHFLHCFCAPKRHYLEYMTVLTQDTYRWDDFDHGHLGTCSPSLSLLLIKVIDLQHNNVWERPCPAVMKDVEDLHDFFMMINEPLGRRCMTSSKYNAFSRLSTYLHVYVSFLTALYLALFQSLSSCQTLDQSLNQSDESRLLSISVYVCVCVSIGVTLSR